MRKAAWRSECSDKCERGQEAAVQSSLFILTEYGPTCFGVREDNNSLNIQVRIGDPHTCTCPDYRKTPSELCKHICWILLKKFRVPKEDPLSWQLGLVESEIDSLLRGYEQRTRRQLPPVHTTKSNNSNDKGTSEDDGSLLQRKLEQDDICPVCQEDFFTKNRKPVTYCRYGCGNSVHMHCMKLWAEHQQSGETSIRKISKDTPINCPICRGKFCLVSTLRLELMTAREYVNSRSNTQLAERSAAPSIPSNDTTSNLLPPLISIQSVASLFVNGSGSSAVVKSSDISQSAIVSFQPHTLTASNLNSQQQSHVTTVETAKDVKISLKKPKPGLQCFQCLTWFKKGTIVFQLPCHHLIHKSCVDEKDLTCAICHSPFLLPRPAALSAPSTSQKSKKNIPAIKNNHTVAIHNTIAPEKHYVTDLAIGQMVQLNKMQLSVMSNKINSRLAKSRLAPHNFRSATANGEPEGHREQLLPSTFCLTATQVVRFAP